jgi:hypothetical protein
MDQQSPNEQPPFKQSQHQKYYFPTISHSPLLRTQIQRNTRRRYLTILLLIIGIVLFTSTGIWAYLDVRSQKQNIQTSQSQWIQLPPNATPTLPANGYLFKDTTGGFVLYQMPATPPASFTWATYRNPQDGYVIDYPSNWMRVETFSNGHTVFAFYPPGTDPNENVPGGPQGVSFRWSETYQPVVQTDTTITDIKPVTIDGVTGQLYTQRSLGATIIVTFPLKGQGFIFITDATSDILIYVFQHMLASLKFT